MSQGALAGALALVIALQKSTRAAGKYTRDCKDTPHCTRVGCLLQGCGLCNGAPSCGDNDVCSVSICTEPMQASKVSRLPSFPPLQSEHLGLAWHMPHASCCSRELTRTYPLIYPLLLAPLPPAEQPAASPRLPSPSGSRASPTARATAASLTTPTALAQSSPTPARAPTALPSQQHPARAPAATSSSRSWRLMPVSSPFSLCPPPHTHTRTCTQACTLPACCTLLDVCTPHTHFDLSGMLQLILTRAPPPPFSSCLQTLPARAPPRGQLPP